MVVGFIRQNMPIISSEMPRINEYSPKYMSVTKKRIMSVTPIAIKKEPKMMQRVSADCLGKQIQSTPINIDKSEMMILSHFNLHSLFFISFIISSNIIITFFIKFKNKC